MIVGHVFLLYNIRTIITINENQFQTQKLHGCMNAIFTDLAIECFEKTRKMQPLHPLHCLTNFEIIYDGTKKTQSFCSSRSPTPSRCTTPRSSPPHASSPSGKKDTPRTPSSFIHSISQPMPTPRTPSSFIHSIPQPVTAATFTKTADCQATDSKLEENLNGTFCYFNFLNFKLMGPPTFCSWRNLVLIQPEYMFIKACFFMNITLQNFFQSNNNKRKMYEFYHVFY